MAALTQIKDLMQNELVLQTRKIVNRNKAPSFKNCFTGADAVKWLIMSKDTECKSKQDAVSLGTKLISSGYIYNVIRSTEELKDSKVELYRFTDTMVVNHAHVLVTMLEGKDLSDNYAKFAKCDPYYSLRFYDPETTNIETSARGRVVKRTTAPKWNAEHDFPVRTAGEMLEIKIFDWDRISKNDLIGVIEIKLEDIPLGETNVLWSPLEMKLKGSEKKNPSIRFQLSYRNPAHEAKMAQIPRDASEEMIRMSISDFLAPEVEAKADEAAADAVALAEATAAKAEAEAAAARDAQAKLKAQEAAQANARKEALEHERAVISKQQAAAATVVAQQKSLSPVATESTPLLQGPGLPIEGSGEKSPACFGCCF